ncbi:hypothetical protein, partial [Streptomyces decoyicus]|uniref:hypothetical protein n=1 Tax=Streptomyces decoyicus TaxID=249567 RepID=UPI00382278B2
GTNQRTGYAHFGSKHGPFDAALDENSAEAPAKSPEGVVVQGPMRSASFSGQGSTDTAVIHSSSLFRVLCTLMRAGHA